MKNYTKIVSRTAMAVFVVTLSTPSAFAANLLVNGNFEASTSTTVTPTGWTNIGHSDGVIAYSTFGTPAFDGSYFYDIGGYGSPAPTPGDGIKQSVATTLGQIYTLTFGYGGENAVPGAVTILDVLIGTQLTSFTITADSSGALKKAFTLTSINYTATGASTLISFTQPSSTHLSNHDVVLDGVIFDRAVGGAVPEPATWAMMLVGFGAIGFAARRRQRISVRSA